MSSPVTRYDVIGAELSVMVPTDDGDWVKFDDVAEELDNCSLTPAAYAEQLAAARQQVEEELKIRKDFYLILGKTESERDAARQQSREADEECHNQVARVVVEREALIKQVARLTEAIEKHRSSINILAGTKQTTDADRALWSVLTPPAALEKLADKERP